MGHLGMGMTTGTKPAWDDPWIKKGMTAQLRQRRHRLDAGEAAIGWKLGFGTPAAMARFKIAAPLVGHLMKAALVPSGGLVSLAGWRKPIAEPEIAVHIGQDLGPGADRAATKAAIAALGPAIELVDMDPPPDDVQQVVAGNIYQRHVVLGPRDRSRAGGKIDGLVCRVMRHGVEAARTSDPQANIGELIGLVTHVANVLDAFGERLRAGDVIITGSTTPPLTIEPDEDQITFELDPVGVVSVRFTR